MRWYKAVAAVEFKCRMESSGVILAPSILGPNPGLFIVRIWQGVAEICLRIVLSLCSLCVVGLAGSVVSNIDHVENLDRETRSAGLFVVVVACLALLVEVVILVVRFLNIGIINLHMRKFLIADIVVSVVLIVGYVVAGLTQCVYASKWRDACKNPDVSCEWWRLTLATAVSCLSCAVLAGVLATWSLLFIVRRWYYKILQYMSLP